MFEPCEIDMYREMQAYRLRHEWGFVLEVLGAVYKRLEGGAKRREEKELREQARIEKEKTCKQSEIRNWTPCQLSRGNYRPFGKGLPDSVVLTWTISYLPRLPVQSGLPGSVV